MTNRSQEHCNSLADAVQEFLAPEGLGVQRIWIES